MFRGLPLARKKPIQTKAKDQATEQASEHRSDFDKLAELLTHQSKLFFRHSWGGERRKENRGGAG